MTLTEIAENLWATEYDHFMSGIHFRSRMTVVRHGGELVLHNPVSLTDALVDGLSSLGRVRTIIAPNQFHHLYAGSARARFPEARLLGAPGLAAKRKDLDFDGEVPAQPSVGDWSESLDPVRIEGLPKVEETVFLHRPSASLIVTDLFFNIHDCQGWMSRMVFKMAGAYQRPAQSRLLHFLTKDRAAAAASVRRVLELPFERVLMAHGEVIDTDAKATVENALAWMLSGQPTSASSQAA